MRRTPFLAGATVAAVLLTALPVLAAERVTTSLSATADTTQTPVSQDGDNSVKTTLATCPQTCEGNSNGWRDAYVEFTVTGLPADASAVTASFQVYAWSAATASVTAYGATGGARVPGVVTQRPSVGAALATTGSVVAGYNAFDVSAAITGNGTYTFALRQSAPATRIYWASSENSTTTIRPRLSLTYTPGGGSGDGWRMVFHDEFDGSSLDRAKWNTRNSLVDFDRACITDRPQNLFVSNGFLTERALRETYTCGGETRQFTDTYIDTIGRSSFTYGRFEVRAKSPGVPNASTGLWPAFWLRPEDGGNGEIDVVELPGGNQYYKAATQAIFHDYTPTKQDQRWTFPAGYPGDGFHTYVTEWSSTALIWSIDGVEVWRRTPSTTPWFTEVFNKPYNLRLNFQVGGWLGDPTSATTFPADFVVDYVRVYQR
jgi:hypothetical protein